jgi:membrane protease YdiL (CAAX protease family)
MEISNASVQAMAESNRLSHVMRRHPLSFFFFMAFGFTWVYELVFLVLLHLPLTPWDIPGMIVGPTLSAFIMTGLTEGDTGMGRLLRRYVLWRVGIPWYLLVLIIAPALLLLGILVLPGEMATVRHLVLIYPLSYIIIFFVGGALFEEPGWRGFALPRLQQRFGALLGTILLGALWAFWHLPVYLVPGYNGAGTSFAGIIIPFVEFVISGMAIAVIFTWVFNNTRGSLLLVMLLHASLDAAVPTFSTNPLVLLMPEVILVVTGLLIIVATRGHLSYARYQREVAPPTPETMVKSDLVTSDRMV